MLAQRAVPVTILKAEHPDYSAKTAAAVGALLCEGLPDGYLDALATRNALDPATLAKPLGEAAYTLKWPACLRARTDVTYTVRTRDDWTAIRMAVAGEFANGPGLKEYFANSGAPYGPGRTLVPGTVMHLPFQTYWTSIRLPEESADATIKALQDIGGRTIRFADGAASKGHLIGPVVGTLQGTEADCDSETDTKDYPFNALEVANAYSALHASQQSVMIAIIDNGFFGLPCSADKCPSDGITDSDFSPRFPKAFFAGPRFYIDHLANIGVNVVIGPSNYPDLKASDIDEVSGHGTHVAGLALGGPTYVEHRSTLVDRDSDEARLELAIVALSRGTLSLDADAVSRIVTAIASLKKPGVINMSIAFDDKDSGSTFSRLFQTQNSLFVVAAGNGPAGGAPTDLDSQAIYPAALGGKNSPNVITVTSIDSNRRLSAFANHGTFVDIAAPGCRIWSWLDAESDQVPISGTSQAAPLVTFASALLMSKWPSAAPRDIKNRLIYSGDLIPDDVTGKVWTGVALSIPKALFLQYDVVSVQDEGKDTYSSYLGRIDRFSGVTCNGSPREFDDIRALKRSKSGRLSVYTASSTGPVEICAGEIADHTPADPSVANMMTFTPLAQLIGASVVFPPPDRKVLQIPVARLIDYVKREY
jgi:subtilisin family serine protease